MRLESEKTSLKNRKNGYSCKVCGARFVTVDIHDGVTPFMVSHRRFDPNTLCSGLCESHFYRVPQELHPTHEWFKRNDEDARRFYRHEPAMLDHVLRGGLELRAREDTATVVHGDGRVETYRITRRDDPIAHTSPHEQPDPPAHPVKGTDRNAPCPCGSGKKRKRCHSVETHP